MKSPNVIVIGAGIGGITAAAHLARRGYRVTIVDKSESPGGRCSRLTRDGHHFDVGPTLLVMPEVYARAFADLGERMENLLDLRRIDPTYHIYFADGSTLALTSDLARMRPQLEALEPGSFPQFLRYFDESGRHYRLSLSRLVDRDFRSLFEFTNPANLALLFRLKVLVKHYRNAGKFFKDPRLKAAFTFQDLYCGLSPFEAVATFSLLSYIELADGVWFPKGGMFSVVRALMGIAEKWGVKFRFNARADRIEVKDGRATGVALRGGELLEADAVIANADLPYVYSSLLPKNGSAARMERKRYSCSTINFYWGVDKRYPGLTPHTLFLGRDYKETFESIIVDLSLSDDPAFYLHAPVGVDPALAPEGEDTLIAMVPVGHLSERSEQDWDEIKKRAREAVLRRLGRIGMGDLEEHLKFEICYTPINWRSRFNLVKGATHGLSHTLGQMFYFRPRNRHRLYRNLYFVGASTHPGTGIPCVLISARLAAERITEDIKVVV